MLNQMLVTLLFLAASDSREGADYPDFITHRFNESRTSVTLKHKSHGGGIRIWDKSAEDTVKWIFEPYIRFWLSDAGAWEKTFTSGFTIHASELSVLNPYRLQIRSGEDVITEVVCDGGEDGYECDLSVLSAYTDGIRAERRLWTVGFYTEPAVALAERIVTSKSPVTFRVEDRSGKYVDLPMSAQSVKAWAEMLGLWKNWPLEIIPYEGKPLQHR